MTITIDLTVRNTISAMKTVHQATPMASLQRPVAEMTSPMTSAPIRLSEILISFHSGKRWFRILAATTILATRRSIFLALTSAAARLVWS